MKNIKGLMLVVFVGSGFVYASESDQAQLTKLTTQRTTETRIVADHKDRFNKALVKLAEKKSAQQSQQAQLETEKAQFEALKKQLKEVKDAVAAAGKSVAKTEVTVKSTERLTEAAQKHVTGQKEATLAAVKALNATKRARRTAKGSRTWMSLVAGDSDASEDESSWADEKEAA